MGKERYLCAGLVAAWAIFSITGCTKKTEQPTTSSADGRTSTAPSGREAANQKMALVRFVNATPGQKDLWFGNDQAFTNIAYKTVTSYRELPGKREDFKLRTAGTADQGNGEATNSEGLTDGAHYTVVALQDKTGNPKLNVIKDDLVQPADGRAKVRVVNASEDEVDVYAPVSRKNEGTADRAREGTADRAAKAPVLPNEDKWFGGVNANSATSYKDVDPVNSTLTVKPTSNKNNAMNKGVNVPVDLASGKLYSLVVTGGGHGQALDVVKVVDELGPPSPIPAGAERQ